MANLPTDYGIELERTGDRPRVFGPYSQAGAFLAGNRRLAGLDWHVIPWPAYPECEQYELRSPLKPYVF